MNFEAVITSLKGNVLFCKAFHWEKIYLFYVSSKQL